MSHTNKMDKGIMDALKNGYILMSEINLEEANLSKKSDNDAFRICEEELAECECKSDSKKRRNLLCRP